MPKPYLRLYRLRCVLFGSVCCGSWVGVSEFDRDPHGIEVGRIDGSEMVVLHLQDEIKALDLDDAFGLDRNGDEIRGIQLKELVPGVVGGVGLERTEKDVVVVAVGEVSQPDLPAGDGGIAFGAEGDNGKQVVVETLGVLDVFAEGSVLWGEFEFELVFNDAGCAMAEALGIDIGWRRSGLSGESDQQQAEHGN